MLRDLAAFFRGSNYLVGSAMAEGKNGPRRERVARPEYASVARTEGYEEQGPIVGYEPRKSERRTKTGKTKEKWRLTVKQYLYGTERNGTEVYRL